MVCRHMSAKRRDLRDSPFKIVSSSLPRFGSHWAPFLALPCCVHVLQETFTGLRRICNDVLFGGVLDLLNLRAMTCLPWTVA